MRRNQYRKYCVRVGYTAGVDGNEAACLHDLVIRTAVHHEVLDYRERTATPRLHGDSLAVFELTHMQLAGGNSGVGSVRVTVDVHRAHTADTLAAVMIVGHGVFVLCNKLLVQDINHLQERSALEYMFQLVGLEMSLSLRAGLTPYPYFNINILIHD